MAGFRQHRMLYKHRDEGGERRKKYKEFTRSPVLLCSHVRLDNSSAGSTMFRHVYEAHRKPRDRNGLTRPEMKSRRIATHTRIVHPIEEEGARKRVQRVELTLVQGGRTLVVQQQFCSTIARLFHLSAAPTTAETPLSNLCHWCLHMHNLVLLQTPATDGGTGNRPNVGGRR